MGSLIKVSNLVREYVTGTNKVLAVDDISFEIQEGEFVIILGPSGCGKSTLLNILGGMDRSTGGSVTVDGKLISSYSEKELNTYRRNDVGFVFQFYNLMPNLTVYENVEISRRLCANPMDTAEALGLVGLNERKKHFPSELSGGEQQRVSIARAMSKNPKLLLCDEPTGALDSETGKKVLMTLWKMCKENNRTVIIVTHNSTIADAADKIICLRNGKISEMKINPSPVSIESIDW